MDYRIIVLLASVCQVAIAIGMVCIAYSNRMISNEICRHYKKCEDYKNNVDTIEIADELEECAEGWQKHGLKGVATRARDWAQRLREITG